jgi:hypothetical protein
MDKNFRHTIEVFNSAKPVSGFRPQTEAEWEKLQQAHIELGFAIFKAAGASNSEARTLSELINGGAAGRLLLEIAFSEDNHD